MERFRPLLAAARLDLALLAPCAVFVGSSFARFDAQPGPGLPAFLLASLAAFLAAAGVNLVDEAWDLWGAPPEGPMDSRDAAVGAGLFLIAALVVSAGLVPLSGAAAVGYGFVAVLLGVLRRVPAVGLDTLGRGLGDVASVVALGPLAATVGYSSQAGYASWGGVLAGVPAGLIAAVPLYTRHFIRREADRRLERLSPLATLGEDAARMGFLLFPALALAAIAAIVAAEEGPRGMLVATIPVLVLLAVAWRGAKDPSADGERLGTILAAVAAASIVTLGVTLLVAVR